MIFCRERLSITIYYILIILLVKMAKEIILNLSEKTKIDVYRSEGYSNRAIAKKNWTEPNSCRELHQGPRGMENVLKEGFHCLYLRMRKEKSSELLLILPKLRAQAGVEASKSSIRRVIKICEYLKYLKLQKKPPLNAPRKEKRLQFTRDNMVWDVQQRGHVNDWRTVCISG